MGTPYTTPAGWARCSATGRRRSAPRVLGQQRRRDVLARRPLVGLHVLEEAQHGGVECRRLFQVGRVPTLRQHEQPGAGDLTLEEERGFEAWLVLVADDHQRGYAQRLQSRTEIVDRRAPKLDAEHRISGAARG